MQISPRKLGYYKKYNITATGHSKNISVPVYFCNLLILGEEAAASPKQHKFGRSSQK